MERTEAEYRDLAKQRETERAQRLLAITKQSIESDPIASKLLRSNRWNKVMNATDAPKLQTYIRLSFARGRRYNTAVHTIDELGWFAASLGCKDVIELEHAICPYLVDERSGEPYKDCDIKAYSMLADFLAYLSDKGFKANSRVHAIATAGKFIRSFGYFYWNKELFRQYCQLPSEEEAEDVDLTRHEVQLLMKYMTFSTKRRFLAMLATGLNPIDLSKVKVKDVHFDEAIPRIVIIRAKTKTKFETFITPEARDESLKHLPHNIPRSERVEIDLKNPEQRIWGVNDDPYQESTVWSNHFRRALKQAAANEPEIARKFCALGGKGKTFSITMRTATRKYFFTQVSKKVGVDFALLDRPQAASWYIPEALA
jgi:integrase